MMRGNSRIAAFSGSQVGRVFLAWTLMSSTLVTSALGETLVLHQHGNGRAHLHLIGYTDFLSNAAHSSRFGHSGRTNPALPTSSQHVRILAIIPVVSLFVTEPRSIDSGTTDPVAAGHCPPLCFIEPSTNPADGCSSLFLTAGLRPAASDDIVLHNHTLLI